MDNRGLNLVDRLLQACAFVVTGVERYKAHVPGGGALNTRGIPQAGIFLARFTKLGIMVYLDKITKTPCEEMA